MEAQTKFLVQAAGAAILAGLAIAQGTRVMEPTYDSPIWIGVLAAAAVWMVFEAWRTKRNTDETSNEEMTERKKK